MATSRETILQRIRQAVTDGNRSAGAPPLPSRGTAGYQGAGADPVERFGAELAGAGGRLHLAATAHTAAGQVIELIEARGARRILVGRGPIIDLLDLPTRLALLGCDVAVADQLAPTTAKEVLFAADVGITGVHALVAETGTIVSAAGPTEPRSLSLLPPVHIAVASRSQLVPDLFDLFAALDTGGKVLPSGLTFITGPSKTGDIELRLVTGVHGPGEVHVVLLPS